MWSKIVNPKTQKKVDLDSYIGQKVLNNYIKQLGGSYQAVPYNNIQDNLVYTIYEKLLKTNLITYQKDSKLNSKKTLKQEQYLYILYTTIKDSIDNIEDNDMKTIFNKMFVIETQDIKLYRTVNSEKPKTYSFDADNNSGYCNPSLFGNIRIAMTTGKPNDKFIKLESKPGTTLKFVNFYFIQSLLGFQFKTGGEPAKRGLFDFFSNKSICNFCSQNGFNGVIFSDHVDTVYNGDINNSMNYFIYELDDVEAEEQEQKYGLGRKYESFMKSQKSFEFIKLPGTQNGGYLFAELFLCEITEICDFSDPLDITEDAMRKSWNTSQSFLKMSAAEKQYIKQYITNHQYNVKLATEIKDYNQRQGDFIGDIPVIQENCIAFYNKFLDQIDKIDEKIKIMLNCEKMSLKTFGTEQAYKIIYSERSPGMNISSGMYISYDKPPAPENTDYILNEDNSQYLEQSLNNPLFNLVTMISYYMIQYIKELNIYFEILFFYILLTLYLGNEERVSLKDFRLKIKSYFDYNQKLEAYLDDDDKTDINNINILTEFYYESLTTTLLGIARVETVKNINFKNLTLGLYGAIKNGIKPSDLINDGDKWKGLLDDFKSTCNELYNRKYSIKNLDPEIRKKLYRDDNEENIINTVYIMYLKGGTTYRMLLHRINNGNLDDKQITNKLGKQSDFDYNVIVNNNLNRIQYDTVYNLLVYIYNSFFKTILSKAVDPIGNAHSIINDLDLTDFNIDSLFIKSLLREQLYTENSKTTLQHDIPAYKYYVRPEVKVKPTKENYIEFLRNFKFAQDDVADLPFNSMGQIIQYVNSNKADVVEFLIAKYCIKENIPNPFGLTYSFKRNFDNPTTQILSSTELLNMDKEVNKVEVSDVRVKGTQTTTTLYYTAKEMAFYELNAHFCLLRLMLNLPTDRINGIKCNQYTKVELIDISIIKYESKEKLDTWNYARSNITKFHCFLVNYLKNGTDTYHNYKKVDIPIYNIDYAIHDLELTIDDNIRTNNIKKLPKRKKRLKMLKKIKCLNVSTDCPDILELDNVDKLLVSDLKITNNKDKYYKEKEKTEFNKILNFLKDRFNEELKTGIYNINHLDILNIKHLIEYIFQDFKGLDIYTDLMEHIDRSLLTYTNTYNGTQQHITNELGEFTNPDLKYDDDLDDLYKDFIYNKLFNLDYKSIIRLLFKIYKNSYRILGIYYLRYLIYSNLYNLEYANIPIETYNHELYDSEIIEMEHEYVANCGGLKADNDDDGLGYTITGGKYTVSNIDLGVNMIKNAKDEVKFGKNIIENSIYAHLYCLAKDEYVSTRGLPIKFVDVYAPENFYITKIYRICYNIINLLETREFNKSIKIFAFNNNNDLSAGMLKYQNSIYILNIEAEATNLIEKLRSLVEVEVEDPYELHVHKDYYGNDICTFSSRIFPLLNVIILKNVKIINSYEEETEEEKATEVKLTLEEPSFITFDTQKHGLIQLISYYARQRNLALSPDKYYIYNKYSKNISSNKFHNLNLKTRDVKPELKKFTDVRYYDDSEVHIGTIKDLNPGLYNTVNPEKIDSCLINNYPIYSQSKLAQAKAQAQAELRTAAEAYVQDVQSQAQAAQAQAQAAQVQAAQAAHAAQAQVQTVQEHAQAYVQAKEAELRTAAQAYVQEQAQVQAQARAQAQAAHTWGAQAQSPRWGANPGFLYQ